MNKALFKNQNNRQEHKKISTYKATRRHKVKINYIPLDSVHCTIV